MCCRQFRQEGDTMLDPIQIAIRKVHNLHRDNADLQGLSYNMNLSV